MFAQEYAKARGKYIIDEAIMRTMRKDAVVMHPLPRVDEVRPRCVDSCGDCSYWHCACCTPWMLHAVVIVAARRGFDVEGMAPHDQLPT